MSLVRAVLLRCRRNDSWNVAPCLNVACLHGQLLAILSTSRHRRERNIDFIRLRSPVVQEFYIEQPFDIQVQGDYHRIAAFLSGVAGLPRIVTLHDFTLEPVEGEDTLRLSILAKTYNHRAPAADAAEEKVP